MDQDNQQLKDLRRQIDALDTQIIQLFAERMECIKKAAKYKQAHGLPALDETRWKQATEARSRQAQKLGISDEFVSELYELIHEYTLQIERDLGAK